MKARIMSEIEKEELFKYLEERFGIERSVFSNYEFFRTTKKIWIASKSLANLDLRGITIEGIGMHFATFDKKRKRFKITTNAAQLFGIFARKNVVEISENKLLDVLRGFDLINYESDAENGYILFKYNSHILGVGLKTGNYIKNMIPKERRLKI